MEESIMEMMDGPVITAKKKAVDNAIEAVEEKYIEYFKSQPPIFEEDGYLRLNRIITRVYLNTGTQPGNMKRDVTMGMDQEIPDNIWKDLTAGVSNALHELNQNI